MFPMHQTPDADVYVLQRRMEYEWPVLAKALRKIGKTVISETDDWFLGLPPYNPAFRGTNKYKRSHAVSYDKNGQPAIVATRREGKSGSRENMHMTLAHSDAVTVSTNFLAEQYARYNPNIHVIPNYLDWEMWEDVTPQYEVERPRIRVGWMGSMRWRKGDLSILRGLIGPWLRRNPNVDFVAAGDDNTGIHDFLEVPEDQRVTYGRAPFKHLNLITPTMDIGLVPLEMNNFNEAKSDLKGKEYAACGVPCIASPTESYRGWVEEGSNGFLARKPRHWTSHLDTLVSDDELRRNMGRAAREKARQNTIQEHVGRWESVYQSYLKDESLKAEPLFAQL
jgi:glycosyltransferase involved in cell wall biosynthesis